VTIGNAHYYLDGQTLYKKENGMKKALVKGTNSGMVVTNGQVVYYGKGMSVIRKNLKDGTEQAVYTETVPAKIKKDFDYSGDMSDFSLGIVGVYENRIFFFLEHTVGSFYLKMADTETGETRVFEGYGIETGKMDKDVILAHQHRRDASEALRIHKINMKTLEISK